MRPQRRRCPLPGRNRHPPRSMVSPAFAQVRENPIRHALMKCPCAKPEPGIPQPRSFAQGSISAKPWK